MFVKRVGHKDGNGCIGHSGISVAAFFSRVFYSVRSKMAKITRIFDNVELLKDRGVTYWAEKNGPMVIKIISG